MRDFEKVALSENEPNSQIPLEKETAEQVQGAVLSVNRIFKKKFNLSVPETALPTVVLADVENPAYNHLENIIKLKNVNQIAEGPTLGEEMGHFYRTSFCPQHKEANTDEFFGWMGRRLLFQATKDKEGKSDFFPKGEPEIAEGVKREIIENTKATKKQLRELKKQLKNRDLGVDEFLEKSRPLKESRASDTHHFRGYEFASKVDINSIKDWEKFFSMPDEEVRKRFFTDNPDYSGIESLPPEITEDEQMANLKARLDQLMSEKPDVEQVYDSGKVWNILSRHYFEWGKSINPEDLKTIKEYQRWSLPVNSFLRGDKMPESATEQDFTNINTIVETLDKTMENCPSTPVEFMAYRAVSSDMTLKDAEKMVGKSTTLDKGFMSTSTSKKLTVNDFLQKEKGKILFEIVVPKGEKGIWVPSVTDFSEIAGREGEFLLPRDSQFVVTGAEEQQFINRRSRNAEDSSAYGKERQSPPQFAEKRLVIKLTLQNKNKILEEASVKQEEKSVEAKQPKKSWLGRIFGR